MVILLSIFLLHSGCKAKRCPTFGDSDKHAHIKKNKKGLVKKKGASKPSWNNY
jgi:hypothetical protein